MKNMMRWFSLLLLLTTAFAQVTVTGGFNATSSAVITWNTTSGATSYNVLRGNTGGPYTQITPAGTVTSPTYTDSAAPKGQNCWVIQAVNSNGTSPNSTEACGVIP